MLLLLLTKLLLLLLLLPPIKLLLLLSLLLSLQLLAANARQCLAGAAHRCWQPCSITRASSSTGSPRQFWRFCNR
jgi:hypothetical protein